MPGPPPNPNARRTNDKDAWRTLPHKCDRRAPAWPLGVRPKGQSALWRYLWSLPVAEIWHEQNAVRLVARYAVLTLAFENGYASIMPDDDDSDARPVDLTKIPAELRQIEDRLLISPSTRIRARVVVAERPATVPGQRAEGVPHLDDYRDLGIA
jgi:hypothetical protein